MQVKVYYQRHSTATRGKEHREPVGLVKTEARQRYTPGEKGYGCPPSEKEHNKEVVVIYIGQFFCVFVFLSANFLVSFFTSDLSWDSPLLCTYPPSAKMDLEVEASGRSKTHYGLAFSQDF